MKVLLPVDGSDNALRAAEYLARWMQRDDTIRTTLISVANIGRQYMEMLGREEEYLNIVSREVQPILDAAEKVFSKCGLEVDTRVGDGNPGEVIAAVAQEEGFEHIVMGRRGLGALEGIFLGSVSQKVLNLVDCPVTLIK